MIDGKMYTKGMSCNIPNGTTPTIYLAADPTSQLNWDDVRAAMAVRLKEVYATEEKEDIKGKTVSLSSEEVKKILSDEDADATLIKVLLGILSFLFPLIGWILYFYFRKKDIKRAKICSKWAWIGFAIGMIFNFVRCIFIIASMH